MARYYQQRNSYYPDPNVQQVNENLIFLIKNNNDNFFYYFQNQCANRAPPYTPALHVAAELGKTEIVKGLCRGGALINHDKNEMRDSALHRAAENGHLGTAAALISLNAKINHIDKFGQTPLHRAASRNRVWLCRLLLEHGAQASFKDQTGQSAAALAKLNNNNFLASRLKNVEKHQKDIRYAIQKKDFDQVKKLLDVEEWLSVVHTDGIPSLRRAYTARDKAIYDLLVKYGAENSSRPKNFHTEQDWVCMTESFSKMGIAEDYGRGRYDSQKGHGSRAMACTHNMGMQPMERGYRGPPSGGNFDTGEDAGIIMIANVDETLWQAAEHLKNSKYFTLDCEGFSPTGPALLQLGTYRSTSHINGPTVALNHPVNIHGRVRMPANGPAQQCVPMAYIVDLASPRHRDIVATLVEVLESSEVVKVIHDLHYDAWQLHMAYWLHLNSVIDTQLAGELLTEKVYMGMGNFVEQHGGSLSEKKDTQEAMAKDPDLWHKRPLSDQLLKYAADDVIGLLMSFQKFSDKFRERIKSIIQASQVRCDRATHADNQTISKRPMGFRGPNRMLCSAELIRAFPDLGASIPEPIKMPGLDHETMALLPADMQLLLTNPPGDTPHLRELVVRAGRPATAVLYSLDGATSSFSTEPSIKTESYTQDDLAKLRNHITERGREQRSYAGDRRAGQSARCSDLSETELIVRPSPQIPGVADIILDHLVHQWRKCIAVLGPPRCGKTVLLHDMERIFSQNSRRACLIPSQHSREATQSQDGQRRPARGSFDATARAIVSVIEKNCYDVLIIDDVRTMNGVAAVERAVESGLQVIVAMEGSLSDVKTNALLSQLLSIRSLRTDATLAQSQSQSLPRRLAFQTIVEVLPHAYNKFLVTADITKAMAAIRDGGQRVAQYRERDHHDWTLTVQLAFIDADGSMWEGRGRSFRLELPQAKQVSVNELPERP